MLVLHHHSTIKLRYLNLKLKYKLTKVNYLSSLYPNILISTWMLPKTCAAQFRSSLYHTRHILSFSYSMKDDYTVNNYASCLSIVHFYVKITCVSLHIKRSICCVPRIASVNYYFLAAMVGGVVVELGPPADLLLQFLQAAHFLQFLRSQRHVHIRCFWARGRHCSSTVLSCAARSATNEWSHGLTLGPKNSPYGTPSNLSMW